MDAPYIFDFWSHGLENSKNIPTFFFYFVIITLAATSFLKRKLFEYKKTHFLVNSIEPP